MGVSYKKLWVLLIEKDITRAQMRRDLKIATGTRRVTPKDTKIYRRRAYRFKSTQATMSKLNKGEEVALSVLLRICDYLDCDIGDICFAVKPKKEENV